MGDRLTDGENAKGDQTKQAGTISVDQVFDELFPYYLSYGMTPEEYWDGPVGLKTAYRKSFEIRAERDERIADRNGWLNGLYVKHALESVYLLVNGFVPKNTESIPYPEKPILQEEREKEEKRKQQEEQKRKEENQMKFAMAMAQAMFTQFNKNFEKRKENQGHQ